MNTIQVDLWIKQRKSCLFHGVAVPPDFSQCTQCGRASRVSAEGPLWGFSPGGKLRLSSEPWPPLSSLGSAALAVPALVIARFPDGPKAAFVVARLDGHDGGIPGSAGAPGLGSDAAAGLGRGRAGVGRAGVTVPSV